MLALECWQKLDTCRQPGQYVAGPIPRLAVKQWAEWEHVDSDLACVIADVIHGLDVTRSRRISSELALKGKKPKR